MKCKKTLILVSIFSLLLTSASAQKKTAQKKNNSSVTAKSTTTTKSPEAKKAVDEKKKNPNQKAKKEVPVVYNADFEKGEELFQLNRPEKAIGYFEKALEDENVDPKLYIYLGVCYYQMEQYDKSLATCVQGLAKEGTDHKILAYNAGNSCYAMGNYMRADASYAIALKEDSNYSPAVLNRANAQLKLDHLGDARENYIKYLEIEPSTPQREHIEEIIRLLEAEIERRAKEKPELINPDLFVENEKMEVPDVPEKVEFELPAEEKPAVVPKELVKDDAVAPKAWETPKEETFGTKISEEKNAPLLTFEKEAEKPVHEKVFSEIVSAPKTAGIPPEFVGSDAIAPAIPPEQLRLEKVGGGLFDKDTKTERVRIDDEIRRFEEERLRLEAENRRLEEARRAAEEEKSRLEAEKRRKADEEASRIAEENRRKADENARIAEENRRKAAENEERLAAEKRALEEERRNLEKAKMDAEIEAQKRALEEQMRKMEESRKAFEAEQQRVMEENRRKMEEEARLAEEKRKIEDARRAFEAEQQKIMEENRRKMEEEARIKAEAEAKAKAEAEAKAKAEEALRQEEARKAAEEAAKLKAEEEAKKAAEEAHRAEVASWPEAAAFLSVKGGSNFTPDGDGQNDKVVFMPDVKYLEEKPQGWTLSIYDPQGNLFRTIQGSGALPKSIEWDGTSDKGEVVLSKNTYTAKLSVTPGEKDRARLGANPVVTTEKIRTGLLLQVIIPGKEWKMVVNSINFVPNGALEASKLSREQKDWNNETLDEIAEQIKEHPGASIVIVEGYANNVSGTEKENREELVPLSEVRANAIVDELVKRGVSRDLLQASGMGGSNPLAAQNDRANWYKNRRVEFRIKK